jgi:hypothetical protein
MNNRTIPMTDDKARPLLPANELIEPLPSSIVLTQGLHGTGWQRHYADGKWHRLGGGTPVTWEFLLKQKGLVLVYDADERPAPSRVRNRPSRKTE